MSVSLSDVCLSVCLCVSLSVSASVCFCFSLNEHFMVLMTIKFDQDENCEDSHVEGGRYYQVPQKPYFSGVYSNFSALLNSQCYFIG